jgi:hypothetical protein
MSTESRLWDIEVQRVADELIRDGTPPWQAHRRAVGIVSRRRQEEAARRRRQEVQRG